jgi:hypothetical protein
MDANPATGPQLGDADIFRKEYFHPPVPVLSAEAASA